MIRTITKVGNLEGNLLNAVKRYSDKFVRFEGLTGTRDQAAMIERTEKGAYFLVTSKYRWGVHPRKSYNFIFALTSDNKKVLERVLQEFQERTGVKLRAAPELLSTFNSVYDILFNEFKDNPEELMELFREKDQLDRARKM